MSENVIKNLGAVAQRVYDAVGEKENIYVCGDTDVDGVCSVIIFKETVESLDGSIQAYYFPDREKGGYGLNPSALKFFSQKEPGLLVLLDLGIANVEEIAQAQEAGFDVVVIDHHQVLDQKPPASIIVDPCQEEDHYVFPHLAAAGLAYKLSQEIYSLAEIDFLSIKDSLVELAALATLADMVPLKKDNAQIMEEGSESFAHTSRLGLQLLKQEVGEQSSPRQRMSQMISLLNMSEVQEDHIPDSFSLLTSQNKKEIQSLIDLLVTRRRNQDQKKEEMLAQLRPVAEDESVVFAGDSSWKPTLVGSVASKLAREYSRPVFLYCRQQETSYGSVRGPEEVDVVQLMKKCSSLLINFGGHSQAAGFTIDNQNLDKFKQCLIENYEQKS